MYHRKYKDGKEQWEKPGRNSMPLKMTTTATITPRNNPPPFT